MITVSTENRHLRIKKLCKERGHTLKWLADQIGVAPEALNRSISIDSNPTLTTLTNIAKALNVPIQDLFIKSIQDVRINGFIELEGTIFKINNETDLTKVMARLKIIKQNQLENV